MVDDVVTQRIGQDEKDQGTNDIGAVKCGADQLGLQLRQREMRFTEGTQDTIGSSDESPEEEDQYQCTQGAVIGRLFGLGHKQSVV
jgi:hypothetical protein